jgi:hypothetical protein
MKGNADAKRDILLAGNIAKLLDKRSIASCG